MKLYTTGCPKCNILKAKLDAKNIQYDIDTDITVLIEKGIQEAPILELDDGTLLNFVEANQYVNEYK